MKTFIYLFGFFVSMIAFFLISCGQQRGRDGAPGVTGPTGANGHSVVVRVLQDTSSCPNGGKTILAATDMNDSGVLDAGDGNIQSAEVCNGSDGEDAPPTDFTPVQIVNPCGDARGVNDEVFLRLANGLLLASVSDNESGKNTRFSVLPSGTYMTTDGDKCYFSVDGNGAVYNEHH